MLPLDINISFQGFSRNVSHAVGGEYTGHAPTVTPNIEVYEGSRSFSETLVNCLNVAELRDTHEEGGGLKGLAHSKHGPDLIELLISNPPTSEELLEQNFPGYALNGKGDQEGRDANINRELAILLASLGLGATQILTPHTFNDTSLEDSKSLQFEQVNSISLETSIPESTIPDRFSYSKFSWRENEGFSEASLVGMEQVIDSQSSINLGQNIIQIDPRVGGFGSLNNQMLKDLLQTGVPDKLVSKLSGISNQSELDGSKLWKPSIPPEQLFPDGNYIHTPGFSKRPLYDLENLEETFEVPLDLNLQSELLESPEDINLQADSSAIVDAVDGMETAVADATDEELLIKLGAEDDNKFIQERNVVDQHTLDARAVADKAKHTEYASKQTSVGATKPESISDLEIVKDSETSSFEPSTDVHVAKEVHNSDNRNERSLVTDTSGYQQNQSENDNYNHEDTLRDDRVGKIEAESERERLDAEQYLDELRDKRQEEGTLLFTGARLDGKLERSLNTTDLNSWIQDSGKISADNEGFNLQQAKEGIGEDAIEVGNHILTTSDHMTTTHGGFDSQFKNDEMPKDQISLIQEIQDQLSNDMDTIAVKLPNFEEEIKVKAQKGEKIALEIVANSALDFQRIQENLSTLVEHLSQKTGTNIEYYEVSLKYGDSSFSEFSEDRYSEGGRKERENTPQYYQTKQEVAVDNGWIA